MSDWTQPEPPVFGATVVPVHLDADDILADVQMKAMEILHSLAAGQGTVNPDQFDDLHLSAFTTGVSAGMASFVQYIRDQGWWIVERKAQR